jgi:thioredoxin 1
MYGSLTRSCHHPVGKIVKISGIKGEKMTNEPIHVTDAAFEKTVLQSPVPVVVDFWAPWCGPCKMIAPVLEKMAKEYAGKLIVAKVNTDENQQWASQYGVQGIPTLLFVANGKVLHTMVGFRGEALLRTTVAQFVDVATQSLAK